MKKIIVILGPTSSGKVRSCRSRSPVISPAQKRSAVRSFPQIRGRCIAASTSAAARDHAARDARRTAPSSGCCIAAARLHRKRLQAPWCPGAQGYFLRRGKVPIIAGGTGLYTDTLLLCDRRPLPAVAPNPKLRARLEKKSAAELFKQLQELDPRRAESIDRHNSRRLVRALEIVLTTGQPVPPLVAGGASDPAGRVQRPLFDIFKIGITVPPEALKRRIHMRLAKRLKQGLVGEVKQLHAGGLSWKRLDELGLEYRFTSRHLRGLMSRKEMIHAIEKES